MPRKIITAGLKLGDQTVLGFQGPPGKDGAQGPTGKTGAQGPQGLAGSTPSFSIGTVSTLPAGSSATASITGSSSNPVLNLGIPRGATGASGSGGSGGSGSSGSGSYVTVEAFGAVGDGVTDDTAAFTAALAYGGVVVCTKDAY
ncbi:MAG: glycoside hydrolase family 55 protein, partial [Oscillospiraceae bacterium]|nr:glycoside hydrolase family 55 protein [Oscillospiraceae bacterium]